MKVLVDTAVWSLGLRRRKRADGEDVTFRLESLVDDGRIAMIGPIRQELLSGIKDRAQFDRLREQLRGFPDAEIISDDYETAASFYYRCREKGIQGSSTDFLICAVAVRHEFPIFTTDADFTYFARVLPIELYEM